MLAGWCGVLFVFGLAAGVNVRAGAVTNRAVADTFGLECVPLA